MISAQDKILHVANKLGLTSLKDMQASTGAVYDVDTELSGTIFTQAARHANPSVTNINENQFEVNEALLVETIAFYVKMLRVKLRIFKTFTAQTPLSSSTFSSGTRGCAKIPPFLRLVRRLRLPIPQTLLKRREKSIINRFFHAIKYSWKVPVF